MLLSRDPSGYFDLYLCTYVLMACGHILNKVWGIDELRILLATVQIQL